MGFTKLILCFPDRCLEKTATYVRPVGTMEPKRPKGLTIGNPGNIQ